MTGVSAVVYCFGYYLDLMFGPGFNKEQAPLCILGYWNRSRKAVREHVTMNRQNLHTVQVA